MSYDISRMAYDKRISVSGYSSAYEMEWARYDTIRYDTMPRDAREVNLVLFEALEVFRYKSTWGCPMKCVPACGTKQELCSKEMPG